MATDLIYPDAYVKEGIIYDIKTDDQLPSFEGLVLADLAGRFAIMHTTLTPECREWELVQWGSNIQTTEIQKYLRGKQ